MFTLSQRQQEHIIDDRGNLLATKSHYSRPRKTAKTGSLDKHTQDESPGSSDSSPRLTSVLGKKRLAIVQEVMKNLIMPSTTSPPPSNPGNVKWGKFTANQWQTFGTIILPSALIRMWAQFSSSSKEFRILTNYLHLIHAIDLATKRTTNSTRSAKYTQHMKTYLETLLEEFPGTKLTPYQHEALHVGDQLLDMGPSHAARCFPFEMYNGLLQRISTNHKFGKARFLSYPWKLA